jgi:hypothetical protein
MGINVNGKDIMTPMVHDRHLVKFMYEYMRDNDMYKNAFKRPENLTILTTIGTTPDKDSDVNEGIMQERMMETLEGYGKDSLFEASLKHIGIDDYVVLRKDLETYGDWRCTFKQTWVLDYLESGKCDTDLLLCTDAIDVIFQDDPQKIVDIFNNYDCDMLFMSTRDTTGYQHMPDVKDWVDRTHPGRYLNAGVWIAKVDFLKEFLKESLKYVGSEEPSFDDYKEWQAKVPKVDYPKHGHDQDIFRFMEKEFYPRVKIDTENLMAYRS